MERWLPTSSPVQSQSSGNLAHASRARWIEKSAALSRKAREVSGGGGEVHECPLHPSDAEHELEEAGAICRTR
jgi:hypothetical protein